MTRSPISVFQARLRAESSIPTTATEIPFYVVLMCRIILKEGCYAWKFMGKLFGTKKEFVLRERYLLEMLNSSPNFGEKSE